MLFEFKKKGGRKLNNDELHDMYSSHNGEVLFKLLVPS
jgi:hypothetical protein